MFMVTPVEAKRFSAAFDTELKKLRVEAAQAYKGFATAAFNYILRETPQWTGNAVSNWNFDLGTATYHVDTKWADEDTGAQVFSKLQPNTTAMSEAATRSLPSYHRITLTSHVFINNASIDVDGESYIALLEENTGAYLRKENEPGHMVANCVTRFSALPSEALRLLAAVKPGDYNNKGLA